jgi:hypothetical protein
MFSDSFQNICQEWRQNIFSSQEWIKDIAQSPILPGEAGGFRVQCSAFPCGAYLKPIRKPGDGISRAANEPVEKVTFLKTASSAGSKIENCFLSSKVFPILGTMLVFS